LPNSGADRRRPILPHFLSPRHHGGLEKKKEQSCTSPENVRHIYNHILPQQIKKKQQKIGSLLATVAGKGESLTATDEATAPPSLAAMASQEKQGDHRPLQQREAPGTTLRSWTLLP
jgi:hypothetical protein